MAFSRAVPGLNVSGLQACDRRKPYVVCMRKPATILSVEYRLAAGTPALISGTEGVVRKCAMRCHRISVRPFGNSASKFTLSRRIDLPLGTSSPWVVRANSSGCHAAGKVAYFPDEVAAHIRCFQPQLARLSLNYFPEARNHLRDSYKTGVLLRVSQPPIVGCIIRLET